MLDDDEVDDTKTIIILLDEHDDDELEVDLHHEQHEVIEQIDQVDDEVVEQTELMVETDEAELLLQHIKQMEVIEFQRILRVEQ